MDTPRTFAPVFPHTSQYPNRKSELANFHVEQQHLCITWIPLQKQQADLEHQLPTDLLVWKCLKPICPKHSGCRCPTEVLDQYLEVLEPQHLIENLRFSDCDSDTQCFQTAKADQGFSNVLFQQFNPGLTLTKCISRYSPFLIFIKVAALSPHLLLPPTWVNCWEHFFCAMLNPSSVPT